LSALAAGPGCLSAEATTALADLANATAFSNDIVQLFKASESSAACKQPSAAMTTTSMVNGAGGVALSVTSQSSNSTLQPVLPAQALLLANLGPGGQLISIGSALAQTSKQAQVLVQVAADKFNKAATAQSATVTAQSNGTVKNSYSATMVTSQMFSTTVPPPLNGSYTGTFSGTQFATNAKSCPISGTLGFSASATTIAVTTPGGGSGTVDQTTGNTTFTLTGVDGTSVTCTFGGSLLSNANAPATGSGTWSCPTTGQPNGFTSANGTWTAGAQ
jgi:hypothetical protein